MAKEQTEKSRYPSLFASGVYITCVQLIAEIMCERKAKSQYKELPQRFWEIKTWADFLKLQLIMAGRLKKKYKDTAILAAIRDKRAKNIFSLGAKWLIPIIEEYNSKPEVVVEVNTEELVKSEGVRPSSKKGSLGSLLE